MVCLSRSSQPRRMQRRNGARRLPPHAQSIGSLADVFAHQHHVHHRKRGVEQHEAGETGGHLRRRHRRHAQRRRQDAFDRPGLPAVFGDDPAQLRSQPRQRQAVQRHAQIPAVAQEVARRRQPERIGEQRDEPEAAGHHQPERPEQHRHVGDGARSRARDVVLRRTGGIVHGAFEQQRVTQVGRIGLECVERVLVVVVGAQLSATRHRR